MKKTPEDPAPDVLSDALTNVPAGSAAIGLGAESEAEGDSAAQIAKLRQLLLDGMQRPLSVIADDHFFESLRDLIAPESAEG